MRTVWKFPVVFGPNTINAPDLQEIVHFAAQEEHLFVWAIVDTEGPYYSKRVTVTWTGTETPVASHIGSVQDGPYVWHAWELPQEVAR